MSGGKEDLDIFFQKKEDRNWLIYNVTLNFSFEKNSLLQNKNCYCNKTDQFNRIFSVFSIHFMYDAVMKIHKDFLFLSSN